MRAFCHAEEGGRDNTDSKRVCKVEDLDDRNIIHACSSRLWHEIGWANKNNSFKKSIMYKHFQEANPGKSIKSTVFRDSACICISDPIAGKLVGSRNMPSSQGGAGGGGSSLLLGLDTK
jgi:hypothetical protein